LKDTNLHKAKKIHLYHEVGFLSIPYVTLFSGEGKYFLSTRLGNASTFP
jgi:hypothetical protein